MAKKIAKKAYLDNLSAVVEEVLAYIPKKMAGQKKQAFELFIREFFYLESEEDLKGMHSQELYAIAAHLFQFMQQRKKKEVKIRVYNPTLEKNGFNSPYTMIEVVKDDMPFLVDSISEELTRQNLAVYHLFHPVIGVGRDASGKLSEIVSAKQVEKKIALESVLHFQISHISSAEQQQQLERKLLCVFEAVRLSVEDWKSILAQLDAAISEFDASIMVLEACMLQAESKQAFIENANEIRAFLEWLKKDNFVFLGYRAYRYDKKKNKNALEAVHSSELGVFRLKDHEEGRKKKKPVVPESVHFIKGGQLIEITKANERSVVHRPVHMDCISIKKYNDVGEVVGAHCFVGLFTSQVYYQSASFIPLIRHKIASIEKRSGFGKSGYSRKALLSALEAFPRDELLQASEDYLFDAAIGIVALFIRQRVRVFIRKDDFERFVSCLIYIPREQMNTSLRKTMENILMEVYQGTVANHYTQITEAHMARVQIIIRTTPGKVPNVNVKELEKRLAEVTRLWVDYLQEELKKRMGEKQASGIYQKYENAFSISYTNRFSAEDAYYDIIHMEKVLGERHIKFDLYQGNEAKPDLFHLKIYCLGEQIALSQIMPTLNNMGLHVLAEHTYTVTPALQSQSVWVHHFRFSTQLETPPSIWGLKKNFEQAITKIWLGEIQNDNLNALIINPGLQWRQVVLIRAYAKYLKQLGFPYGQEFIQEALSKHAALTRCIVTLFNYRFNPEIVPAKERQRKIDATYEQVKQLLSKVSNLSEDRVIQGFIDLIMATLRTNFYQKTHDEKEKHYLSFKFHSAEVPYIPLPKPYAEIFVYSSRVEGVHLRGGKVARGGIRWSDRSEDFRTEILGLMKAQMTKNSVIVPVGSKGGFIVKQPPRGGDRDAFIKEGIECYKVFLCGLLDITDNIIGEKIVSPPSVVCYDRDDPYLVVAADKGTATFSDIANAVSSEYKFWLGDAFASGGSAGYDHKKMGITARGAWISVERHFRELGINMHTEAVSVVGVGDMSGDVFGNGMLLSKNIKVIGAFNHQHIFLDPEPHPLKSYKERDRLFHLARSSWKDYNPQLISKGGGVYERSAKSITLSNEAKAVLQTQKATVTPDELIQLLLKAPVDLLWNGGIGTYVKSPLEGHEEVGDRANDNVRVNANEIKARVVGEGGNLGFTQRGRIMYSRLGGKINTDAIDNSGGVDCSDHEVNIKIALNKAVEKKKLLLQDRNKLLSEMTDDVAMLVLRDNRLQTQAITIAEMQGIALSEMYGRLLSVLEKKGLLNRKIEFLPSDEEIIRLHAEGKGLTRPELCVILAYSKMVLYDELLRSSLPDDPYFKNDLQLYFPQRLRKKFKEEIETHPLGREIIATFITNSIVNRVGSTFFHQASEDTGMKAEDIAKAYTITRDVFNLRQLWIAIEALDGQVSVSCQVEMFLEIQKLVERSVSWLLRHIIQPMDVSRIVREYGADIKILAKQILPALSSAALQGYKKRLAQYCETAVPAVLAEEIAGLEALSSAYAIVQVAKKNRLQVEKVGKIYFNIGDIFDFLWIRKTLEALPVVTYWQRLSVKNLVNQIYDQQMQLTNVIISQKQKHVSWEDVATVWIKEHKKEVDRVILFLQDIKSQEKIDIVMIVLATKRIEELYRKKVEAV